MADRKTFLTSLGVTGALIAAARTARGQSAPPSQEPQPAASESPPAPPTTPGTEKRSKGPSAAAVAIAATMRRFDPTLSDAELATIATQIDDNATAGAVLNPKKRRLKNSDEPATTFVADRR